MSENVPTIPDAVLRSMLQQRIADKTCNLNGQLRSPKPKLDPYALMVSRQQQNKGESAIDSPVQKWPDSDIKRLEEFCREHGIIGFNAGRMNPLAALALLKQKLGLVDNSTTSEGYGPNYPYTEAMRKKQILHG